MSTNSIRRSGTDGARECVIDWLTGDEKIALSITAQALRNRIKRLKESHPDEVDYVENKDGSIFAHVPVGWLKINPPKNLTEEQREAIGKRLNEARASREST